MDTDGHADTQEHTEEATTCYVCLHSPTTQAVGHTHACAMWAAAPSAKEATSCCPAQLDSDADALEQCMGTDGYIASAQRRHCFFATGMDGIPCIAQGTPEIEQLSGVHDLYGEAAKHCDVTIRFHALLKRICV